jgi:hypothetical protein
MTSTSAYFDNFQQPFINDDLSNQAFIIKNVNLMELYSKNNPQSQLIAVSDKI